MFLPEEASVCSIVAGQYQVIGRLSAGVMAAMMGFGLMSSFFKLMLKLKEKMRLR